MKALLFFSFFAAHAACHAQSGEAPKPAPREDIAVRGVFTSDLPDLGPKHSLRLTWNPHFGDLTKRDYFRTDMGLKYVLSSRAELRASSMAYFSHGLKDVDLFDQAGFGSVRLEAKYKFEQPLLGKWESAVGARFFTPINDPPYELTDGLERWSAYAAFARQLDRRPEIRVFWGLGFDLVHETSTFGRYGGNDLRDDSHYISGGFVIDRGRTHYTLESKWTSTRLLGSSEQDVFELRPGIVWELGRPREETGKSRWLLGVSVSSSYGPDGADFSLGTRLRGDFDLKRLFRRDKD